MVAVVPLFEHGFAEVAAALGVVLFLALVGLAAAAVFLAYGAWRVPRAAAASAVVGLVVAAVVTVALEGRPESLRGLARPMLLVIAIPYFVPAYGVSYALLATQFEGRPTPERPLRGFGLVLLLLALPLAVVSTLLTLVALLADFSGSGIWFRINVTQVVLYATVAVGSLLVVRRLYVAHSSGGDAVPSPS